ncbi:MAG: hypothetical protein V2A71_10520 [Candidatus Eisenbacteria bacterium]
MTGHYEVKKEVGFIRVTDSRPATAETVQQFCERIPELAREWGVSRILVDHRDIPNSLSTAERFRYATEIAEHFRGLKIAFVQDVPLRDPQLFGETVAVNRGANIRVCSTLEEAYDWLELEPANKPDAGDGK